MTNPRYEHGDRSAAVRMLEWLRDRVLEQPAVGELMVMNRDELDQVARDVGVSADTLATLARYPRDAANLLEERMQALGLDPNEVRDVEPMVLHDLQRLCTQCLHHARCVKDLASAPQATGWRTYCPNVSTLDALLAERAAHRMAATA